MSDCHSNSGLWMPESFLLTHTHMHAHACARAHIHTAKERVSRRVWLIGPNAEGRSRRVRRGSGFRNYGLRWKKSFTGFLRLLLRGDERSYLLIWGALKTSRNTEIIWDHWQVEIHSWILKPYIRCSFKQNFSGLVTKLRQP